MKTTIETTGVIQVCWYTGNYPNHDELDNRLVRSKKDAYEYIRFHKELCKEKWNQSYNYRIVDMLNRFKPIFIETI